MGRQGGEGDALIGTPGLAIGVLIVPDALIRGGVWARLAHLPD